MPNYTKADYTNRILNSDIEGIGFYKVIKKAGDIHCIVSIDYESKKVWVFHDYPEFDNAEVYDDFDKETYVIPPRDGTLLEGVRFWYLAGTNGSKLVIHNCGSYDRPVIEKIWPKCIIPLEAWHDTYRQSKMQWFDRTKPKGAKGTHGLDAYARRKGIHKPDVKDWTTMDAFKLHRCIQDCWIQEYAYEELERERKLLDKDLGINMEEAVLIEDKYRVSATNQENKGALVDVEHMKKCIVELDGFTKDLAAKIEPMLSPTVKGQGTKISRADIAVLFGHKRPADTYKIVTQDGERVKVVCKDYCRPVQKWTNIVKTNSYTALNVSCGLSPAFIKKKELTAWIKEHHPEHPPKEWDITKGMEETEVLNAHTVTWFDVKKSDVGLIGGAFTKVKFEPSTISQHSKVKGKLIKLGWKSAFEWNLKMDHKKQKIRAEEDTWCSYPEKASKENQMHLFVKKGQPLVSSPKLSEEDFEYLPEGLGQDIAHYNSYMHRRRFISNPKDPENKGLMSYLDENNRIPCGVNPFNCSTGRSTQYVWVNSPGEGSLYGEEIRKIIIAPEGRKLVGIDMKSAQLAIAAYYSKNETYYNAVASGQEVKKDSEGNEVYVGESAHCFSARLFGMVSMDEWEKAKETQDPPLLHSIMLRRKGSKAASFGVVFGCAGALLAKMLKIPEREGNEKKDNFLKQMGLDGVQEWLIGCEKKYKRGRGWYIPTVCGYWVYCKSSHKSINYLIQSTEAVCQKIAANYYDDNCEARGITDSYKILDVHDEMLYECAEDEVELVGNLVTEAYTFASNEVYRWHCENPDKFPNKGKPTFAFDLDGGWKVGVNYLATH